MNKNLSPLQCQRDKFDMDSDVLYFNAASKSVILKASVEAGQTGCEAKGKPWAIDEAARYVQADDIRAQFAAMIGAKADDIAIHPAASYGIATAAQNLKPKAGSRILLLEGQFPSNVYAWQLLANASGATCTMIAWPEDDDWTRAVLEEIDETVSIAALPPCHWTDGVRLDLVAIGAALKRFDATFVVDATQWAGALPIDVNDIHADYLVCAAYKWLLGPYGLSFMYAAPKHQNGRPLEDHLFNHGGVDSITSGLGYPEGFTKGARRYDAGEFLNLITLPMIQVALRQINDWQPARIGAYLSPLIDIVADGAADLGLQIAAPALRSPHILGFRRSGGYPADILARLQAEGVHVSSRGGALRVSPYLCNDAREAVQLIERIGRVLHKV